MAKLYKAKVEFTSLADAASLRKLKAARETDDPEERARLQAEVRRVQHLPKDKPFEAPCSEIEKSWLAADVVEEVAHG